MPYVSKEKAQALDLGWGPTTPGELGYTVGKTCRDYLNHRMAMDDNGELRYQYLCDVIGTLETIKLDLCRTTVFEYEAKVEAKNDTFHWGVLNSEDTSA